VKVLHGRPITNPAEPQMPPARPDFDTVPAELQGDEIAATEWARVVPLLRVCGIISTVERPILIALCQQWALYVEAGQDVRKRGMLIKGRSGNAPSINPYVKLAGRALTHCQRLWVELGLTPAARAKLTALQPEQVPKASRWGNDL
jgi:P27 family predicted phage terminase small subunit